MDTTQKVKLIRTSDSESFRFWAEAMFACVRRGELDSLAAEHMIQNRREQEFWDRQYPR